MPLSIDDLTLTPEERARFDAIVARDPDDRGSQSYHDLAPRPSRTLNPAELEVLVLMSHGLGDKEIAVKRHVKVSTIQSQAKGIYRALNVTGRTHAAATAIRIGLID